MPEKILLNGKWNLKDEEKGIEIKAEVPGSVFEALIKNNIIEDPFYGLNEHEVSWVYESEWHYETKFDVNSKFLDHSHILLRFHGLDTISEVYLNGSLLGKTDNMFMSYDFDVKSKLKQSDNSIQVVFKSPTEKAREEIKKHGLRLVTTPEALPGVSYLRKAQYSFGWDWGPKIPDIGIWKSVELIGFEMLMIENLHVLQTFHYDLGSSNLKDFDHIPDHRVNSVDLSFNIELYPIEVEFEKVGFFVKLEITAPDNSTFKIEKPLVSMNQTITLTIEKPILWWIHELGKPNLHEVNITIFKEKQLDIYTQKFGIREILLIRKPDKWGESFYFRLNGIPIFIKGANWIPVDSFIPRGKKQGLYQKNLKHAKAANMNMLRVWGGGIYEDDAFYDICDEFGLLVWQDFPFACHLYYPDNEFIQNFTEEAIQNIKRLRNHPSLAIWCGNNEIEFLWRGLLADSDLKDSKLIKKLENGYVEIFEHILPSLLKNYDVDRPYWPSSPSNGFIGDKLGTIDSNDPNSGDSHYWAVWHSGRSFIAYRDFDSRFMSEFGFESFPSLKTIKQFCPSDQFEFSSPIMENHQKNLAGNKKIRRYMKRRFKIPKDFERQVIVSQITQAEAMEYGVEHWRRQRNDFHCMGALYWQLNDCWPVVSWSSLDHYLRWKALHYYAKRFYAPVFASVKESSDQVELWISNDKITKCQVILDWEILNSDGTLLMEGSHETSVDSCTSLKIDTIDVSNINKESAQEQNHVIFYKLMKSRDDNEIIQHGFRLFGPPKKFSLINPELTFSLRELESTKGQGTECKIMIKSKTIALYVFIDADDMDFIASDNFFSMEPDEERIITLKNVKTLRQKEKLNKKKIQKSLKINSLYDLMKD
ncbi:MAG: glycoside hydrolase family 2 protein [Promethearchaeota archaeon]|nr:MAG: glycoside hydrolase family 2 protein [Candidatus Lokiarchaeota archaeon]